MFKYLRLVPSHLYLKVPNGPVPAFHLPFELTGVLSFFSWTVSCGPGWPRTVFITRGDFELLPPECRNDMCHHACGAGARAQSFLRASTLPTEL